MKRLQPLLLLAIFAGCALLGLSLGRQLGAYAIKGRHVRLSSNDIQKVEAKSLSDPSALSGVPAGSLPAIPTPTMAPTESYPVPASATPEVYPEPVMGMPEAYPEPIISMPETNPEPEAPATSPTEVPHQENILLIGVDDVQAKAPRLEGVWLVLYLSGTPHFTLMPIYPGVPAADGKVTSQDGALVKKFRSDPPGLPGPNFTAELKKRHLWWSGTILFDRQALTQIIDGVSTVEGVTEDEGLLVSNVPNAWKSPQPAKREQGRLAQALCQVAAGLTVDDINQLDQLFLLFSQHILSDIPREQAAAEMVGLLAQGEGITCEFPTMGQ
jgi:hypothetical protein